MTFILVFIVVLVGSCTNSNTNDNSNDNNKNSQDTHFVAKHDHPMQNKDSIASIKNNIGDSLYVVIEKADSVMAYLLNGRLKDTINGLNNFKIIETTLLSDSLQNIIISYVNNTENFKLSKFKKKCGFKPDLAFKFYKNKKELLFLLALDCDVFQIYCKDGTRILDYKDDFDPGHDKFTNFKNNLFNIN